MTPADERRQRDARRKEFFNQRAEGWLDRWHLDEETGTYTRYAAQFERMFSLIPMRPGETVLDLGCGSGVLVPYVLERIGPEGRLLEVDYAEQMIAVNRRLHADPRVSFSTASVDTLKPPAAHYDAVLCFACFPHFERKAETLAMIHHTLKPGGILAIVHFKSSQEMNEHHGHHPDVQHDRLPPETELRAMLMRNGLRVDGFIDEPGFYFVRAINA